MGIDSIQKPIFLMLEGACYWSKYLYKRKIFPIPTTPHFHKTSYRTIYILLFYLFKGIPCNFKSFLGSSTFKTSILWLSQSFLLSKCITQIEIAQLSKFSVIHLFELWVPHALSLMKFHSENSEISFKKKKLCGITPF